MKDKHDFVTKVVVHRVNKQTHILEPGVGEVIQIPQKIISKFQEAGNEQQFATSLIFALEDREDLIVAKRIVGYYSGTPNPLSKKFKVEHWNYHPMRNCLTMTHTTETTLVELHDSLTDTFKALERLHPTPT